MGGSIGVERTPGKGSSFRFTVRLAPALAACGSSEREPVAADVELLEGRRVLLVEDHPVNQRVVRQVLERWRMRVDLAVHGAAALERLQSRRYDVVLMDCQMPVMDDFEATRRLREFERAAGTPRHLVVALTANALDGARERCLAAGMDAYLAKPIKPEVLLDLLVALLARETAPA